jgi:hypothetical protein
MGVSIPSGMEIDHKDTNPFNNSWTNLRLATQSQNAANRNKRLDRKEPELPKGVSRSGKSFRVRVADIDVGRFETLEAASNAYREAAAVSFGEFARPSN